MTVIANLSVLDPDAFWTVMDNRSWMHPFDAEGERRHYKDIPKRMMNLVDDPFRSLCGRIAPRRRVRQGHYAVFRIPVGGFLAPAYEAKAVKRDFDQAMEKALQLAKTRKPIICRAGAARCRRNDRGPGKTAKRTRGQSARD